MALHRIHTLAVELEAPAESLARELSARLGAMRAARIDPELEAACDEVDAGDAVRVLETLEIDLGTIDASRFEAELTARLGAAVRQALREALAGAARPSAELDDDRAWQVVAIFLRSGALPWWAEPTPAYLTAQFAQLARHAPLRLIELLRGAREMQVAVARAAGHIDAEALEATCRAAWGRQGAELLRALRAEHGVGSVLPVDVRVAARALAAVADHRGGSAAVAALLRGLRRGLEATSPRHAEAAAPAAETAAAAGDGLDVEGDLDANPSASKAGAGAQGRPDPKAEPPLCAPSTEPATTHGTSRRPDPPSPAARAHPRKAATGTPCGAPDPAAVGYEPAGRHAVQRAATHRGDRAALARAADLAGLDELWVDNAGLVLLWPFLDRFLERAGLLDATKAFVDKASRAQAIGLLDRVATGSGEIFEPRLPLAKLLCGASPEVPLASAPPATEAQIAEGDNLLRAVIDHAGFLGDPAPERLRQAFLLRRGALVVSQGTWLLRVERRAQDVLLERLPWSLAWIKRPWMPEPLRVEW